MNKERSLSNIYYDVKLRVRVSKLELKRLKRQLELSFKHLHILEDTEFNLVERDIINTIEIIESNLSLGFYDC